jgi:hypothetical protein
VLSKEEGVIMKKDIIDEVVALRQTTMWEPETTREDVIDNINEILSVVDTNNRITNLEAAVCDIYDEEHKGRAAEE